MINLNMRADVEPQQFLAVRAGEYVPLRKIDILPGEQVYYYRGPGYKIEKCSTGSLC